MKKCTMRLRTAVHMNMKMNNMNTMNMHRTTVGNTYQTTEKNTYQMTESTYQTTAMNMKRNTRKTT